MKSRRINVSSWPQKPGTRYVAKFQQMTASAREFDGSRRDLDDSEGKVTFKNGAEEAQIDVRSASHNFVSLVKRSSWKARGSDIEKTSERVVIMEQTSDTTLEVDESHFRMDHDTSDDSVGPKRIGHGQWNRRFLVDIASGQILTDQPDMGNLTF